MHIFLKCQIFRYRQRNLRRDQTLYHRIICQIQEHTHMICHTAFLKCLTEEFRHIVLHTHCSEYNCELFIRIVTKRSLLYDLCRELVMRQSVSREYRKLLPADQCRQTVNRRDSGTDIVSWILPSDRIQRKSVYIPFFCICNRTKSIDRFPDSVKCTSQHFLRYSNFHRMSRKSCMGIIQ